MICHPDILRLFESGKDIQKPIICPEVAIINEIPYVSMTSPSSEAADRSGGSALNAADAARLVANICEITRLKLPHEVCSAALLTRIFDMGADAYEDATHSEAFGVAVEQFLLQKRDLRPDSYREYRAVMRRILRCSPEVETRSVRSLGAEACLRMITAAYNTASTVDKARRLLHCFFRYAMQRNWCRENPVALMWVRKRKELPIAVLNLDEICRLLRTVAQPEHRPCAATIGLMLWCGLRPTEVTRLNWSEVDLEDRVVRVSRRVSKTGGARLVSIQPVLLRWLRRFRPESPANPAVAPTNWTRRWHRLRAAADLLPWQADALRHTFASYHLRHFDDIHKLQKEMGHSTAQLLFSRYLNMGNVTRKAAADFWNMPVFSKMERQAQLEKWLQG